MKKRIIFIVFAALAVVALLAWGYGRASKEPRTEVHASAGGSLTATETLYDFGTISMANGKVSHSFRVANQTADQVTLTNVQTSCMCTSAYLVKSDGTTEGPFGMPGMGGINATNFVIPAQSTQTVDVVFDPAAHGPAGIGDINRFIDLMDVNGKTIELEIKAVVTP